MVSRIPPTASKAISKVLNISHDEADELLMNSKAFADQKKWTLQLRQEIWKGFKEDSDGIVIDDEGQERIHVDLTKWKDEGEEER